MFLRSGNLHLRFLEDSDAPLLFELAKSSNAHLFTTPYWRPWGHGDFAAFVNQSKSPSTPSLRLGICIDHRKSESLIGVIELNKLDWVHGNAEVGIIIWPTNKRKQGYGMRALRTLSEWAFGTLRLRRLYAKMFESNVPSRKLFESVGFKKEGVWREHFFVDGEPVNALLYGLLRDELKD